ncbi:hypothetical protein PIB30_019291 [Stylosanthes scabra]|uniref:Uncharacterized protein n=1 Tax=Stylosanthes scabra TaxID=79078 RepID=A0ABU6UBE6_9FABA|nr:hypothetical protein [Stylosanthes scabra]
MVLNRSHVPVKLSIEWYRLAHLEPNFNVKGGEVIDYFWFVFTKLLKSRTFEGGDLNFAPFARRQIGLNWFRQRRFKEEGKTEAQLIVDKHWSNYLAVQFLLIGFPNYKKDRYKIALHSPHFMARQMGFSQAIPDPYSTDPAKQICQFVPHSFKEIKAFLFENLLTQTFYDPIPCRSSNFVTRDFINAQEEQATQKRKAEQVAPKKAEPSKPTSKKARANPKKPSGNVELPEESNPSEVPSKTTLTSEKPQTSESAQSASGNSLDVSSKSKESSNSKDKRASPEKARIEESTAREFMPSLDIIVGGEKSPCGLSSEGYSISNLSKSAERSNLVLEEIDQALNNPIGKMNSPLKEREIIQEVVSSTPKAPIQAGSNQGIYIDPRIQFKDKLKETRVASVEKINQSMKPLPSIPVIKIDGGDPNLADLLQMISESKVGSEPDFSNSVNKSVPQEKEKEDTPIQKARSESLQKILLKSAAEKMIRLMNQPLDMLQKDPYWNDELVKVTSCLVEQQFSKKYRKQVLCFGKIFENLFLTREKLSDVRLKVAMIQENSNGLIIAEKPLRE